MPRFEFACRHRYPRGTTIEAAWTTEALVTAVLGPSGSGKSTVLAILAGLCRPDWGYALIEGRTEPLFDLRDATRPHWPSPEDRRIGYVIQDHLLFPHLSAAQNLRYGMGRASSQPAVEFDDIVTRLGLGHLLDRRPRHLSGGECQRVALGRALLSRPELLLVDEPFAAIDAALREKLIADLATYIRERALPTVYVTHREEELEMLAAAGVTVATIRNVHCNREFHQSAGHGIIRDLRND